MQYDKMILNFSDPADSEAEEGCPTMPDYADPDSEA